MRACVRACVYLEVCACHDCIAQVTGPQTSSLQASQPQVDAIHLAVVKHGTLQVGTCNHHMQGGRGGGGERKE